MWCVRSTETLRAEATVDVGLSRFCRFARTAKTGQTESVRAIGALLVVALPGVGVLVNAPCCVCTGSGRGAGARVTNMAPPHTAAVTARTTALTVGHRRPATIANTTFHCGRPATQAPPEVGRRGRCRSVGQSTPAGHGARRVAQGSWRRSSLRGPAPRRRARVRRAGCG